MASIRIARPGRAGEGWGCVARNLSVSADLPGAVDQASSLVGNLAAPSPDAAALPFPQNLALAYQLGAHQSEGLAVDWRISVAPLGRIVAIAARAAEIPGDRCRSGVRGHPLMHHGRVMYHVRGMHYGPAVRNGSALGRCGWSRISSRIWEPVTRPSPAETFLGEEAPRVACWALAHSSAGNAASSAEQTCQMAAPAAKTRAVALRCGVLLIHWGTRSLRAVLTVVPRVFEGRAL